MEEGCVARVRQDFFTTNDGELSLRKGELFQVHKVIDKYWCYGCSKGKFGQFPSSNLLSTDTPPLAQHEELFVALEDFPGQEEGDLSFRKGDFIVGEEKMDEHWWRGYVQKGRVGMYPDNYTWHLDSQSLKKGGREQVNLLAKVKMSLTAQLDEEMDLRAGEFVTITEKIDKDWYRGFCGDRSGIFPSSYVTLLDEAPPSYTDVFANNTNRSGSVAQTSVDSNLFRPSERTTSSETGFPRRGHEAVSSPTDLLTFSPEREIKPLEQTDFDINGSAKDIQSVDATPRQRDLLTFSPEKETTPKKDISDEDIFNDDYFKINMPSAFQSSSRPTSQIGISYGSSFGSQRSSFDTHRSSFDTRRSIFGSSFDTPSRGSLIDVEENASSVPPYGVTLYPFYAQFNNELSFHESEFVYLIRYVDNDWLEGEIDGRRGIVPVNYINILVDLPRQPVDYLSNDLGSSSSEVNEPSLPAHSLAKVKYNFDIQMNGDLCVKEGEVVVIVNIVNNDWYTVKNKLGAVGLCPANHLEMYSGPDSGLFRSSSFSSGDTYSHDDGIPGGVRTSMEIKSVSPETVETSVLPDVVSSAVAAPSSDLTSRKECTDEKPKKEVAESEIQIRRPLPTRAVPPPPVARRTKPAMPDRGPHRPAPPAPLPGKSPVHRSIRRLPRQTSAPSDFVKCHGDGKQKEAIEEKRLKLSEQRQNVISELVMTEKEYVRDLKLMYEVFNLHDPSFLESKGADNKVLFGNLLEVIQISEELLDSLQWSMKNKEESEQMVGPCFLKHADTMKAVYTEYCTNHENALALLSKYEACPSIQHVFEKGLETLRYQVTCFNMDSLLIKPVQRVLKYPLILNELIKSTEDDHPDKADLLSAIKVFTNMASDINECKRRKDIVSKYLVNGNDTLARRMGRLSLHSVAKKSSRIGARISSTLGLSTVAKDEKFTEHEKRFRSLEKSIRLLVKNIETVLNQMYCEIKVLFEIGEELVQYCGENSNVPEVDGFRSAQRAIADSIWRDFRNKVNRRVIEPLTMLLDLFEGPSLLIDKCNDKLLDYDNVLARSEKSQDKRLVGELQIARSNYEALNQQLVEELPHFVDLSSNVLVQCVAAFIGARKLLSGNITKRYMTLLEETGINSSGPDPVESFEVKHLLVRNQLARLSFTSKSLKTEGPVTSAKEGSKTPTPSVKQLGSNGTVVPPQPASQCAYLRSRYGPDNLCKLKENHAAADVYELSLTRGHLVGVIKKQDPMGSTYRWFVDDGNVKGFVRSKCLEPAGSPAPSLQGADSPLQISPVSSASPSPSRNTMPNERSPANTSPSLAYINTADISAENKVINHRRSSTDSQRNRHNYDLPPDYDEVAGSGANTADNLKGTFYYSLYDFAASTPNALSVSQGQVVMVLESQDRDGNSEWWHVENRKGEKGYVPANYLHPYSGESK